MQRKKENPELTVTFKVTGFFEVEIPDDDCTEEELEQLAIMKIEEADFGCLKDIEWRYRKKHE